MRIPARIWKEGKFWLIEAPSLDAMTQGHSRKGAYLMLEDWIKSSVDLPRYYVKVVDVKKGEIALVVKDPKPIIALMLQRARSSSGVTYDKLRARLNSKSRNAYRQYETGKHDPGLSKIMELMDAVGFELEINLVKKTA